MLVLMCVILPPFYYSALVVPQYISTSIKGINILSTIPTCSPFTFLMPNQGGAADRVILYASVS